MKGGIDEDEKDEGKTTETLQNHGHQLFPR